MTRINESLVIPASANQLWGLLVNPDEIAKLCPGVSGAVLLPSGEPMHEGSQLEVTLLTKDVVSADVTSFNPGQFSMRSEITQGPHKLHGHLDSRLEPHKGNKSTLFLGGELGCDLLGKVALFGFIAGFKLGSPLISQGAASLAKSRTGRTQHD